MYFLANRAVPALVSSVRVASHKWFVVTGSVCLSRPSGDLDACQTGRDPRKARDLVEEEDDSRGVLREIWRNILPRPLSINWRSVDDDCPSPIDLQWLRLDLLYAAFPYQHPWPPPGIGGGAPFDDVVP